MNPESSEAPKKSEFAQSVEDARERMQASAEIRSLLEETLELKTASTRLERLGQKAGQRLNERMRQARVRHEGFRVKVSNLPPGTRVIHTESFLVDEEVTEYVADHIDANHPYGLMLFNGQQGTHVRLESRADIKVDPVQPEPLTESDPPHGR